MYLSLDLIVIPKETFCSGLVLLRDLVHFRIHCLHDKVSVERGGSDLIDIERAGRRCGETVVIERLIERRCERAGFLSSTIPASPASVQQLYDIYKSSKRKICSSSLKFIDFEIKLKAAAAALVYRIQFLRRA